jgi:hypothetical protein
MPSPQPLAGAGAARSKPPMRHLRVWMGWLIGAVFAAALVWSTLQQSGVECEACVDYHGASACSSVAASDAAEATRQAQASACATLSHGVTEGLECDRTPPRSLRCSQP